jgi:hypothetical protein
MSNYFKFGRPNPRWIHIDLDFSSLYGEQIGKLTGEIYSLTGLPPSAQGKSFRLNSIMSPNVDVHNTNERDIIMLTRRDLSRGRGGLPIGMINGYDFADRLRTHEFNRASFVFFMDDDGTIKTLKNRYGSTN